MEKINKIREDTENLLNKVRKFKNKNTTFFTKVSNEITEIDSVIEDVEKRLNDLLSSIKSSDNSKKSMMDMKNELTKKSNNIIEGVKKGQKQNKEFFKELNSGMDTILQIKEIFNELKDVAERLNVLSINSFIGAYNSGKEGKGLGRITEEISKYSKKLNYVLDDVSENTIETFKFYRDFEYLSTKIHITEDNIITTINEKFQGYVNDYLKLADKMSNQLKEEKNRIEMIVNQIGEYMNLVQVEDILRQKMEHIEKIALKLMEILDDDTGKYKLNDYLVFIEKAFDMIDSIIDDTFDDYREFMNNSINKFESILDSSQVINRKNELINDILGSKAKSEIETVEEVVNNLDNLHNNYIKLMRKITAAENKILEDWQIEENLIENIQECLKDVDKINKQLNTIAVISRIEINRSSNLSLQTHLYDDIKLLINNIEKSIVDSKMEVKNSYVTIDGSIKEFQIKTKDIKKELKQINTDLSVTIEDIVENKEDIINTTDSLQSLTDQFFNKLSEYLNYIKNNKSNLLGYQSWFKEIYEDIEIIIEDLKNKHNIETLDENIDNDALSEIVEDFTIHYHKIIAHEDASQEQEEVYEPREEEEMEEDENITLF